MRQGMSARFSVVALSVLVSSSVYAVAPGFYMGLMAGPATNTADTQNVQVLPYPTSTSPAPNVAPANPKSSQFGSRVFLGYKFNPYASFEGGFVFFSGVNYQLENQALKAAASTTARLRAIDVLGKVDYTFQNTVGVFGKAGVAATYLTTPGGLNPTGFSTSLPPPTISNPTPVPVANQPYGSNKYTTKAVPVVAVGVSYDLDQNWVMDASYMSYMVGGAVGNMDLYGLGISYHFVDKYCGQFLCDD